MNNGNFNGYTPNGNGQNNGFMGGYDPEAQQGQADSYGAPYNSNAYPPQYNGYPSYSDTTTTQGYAPYSGGTFSNPAPQPSYQTQAYPTQSYQTQPMQQPYQAQPDSGYAPYAPPQEQQSFGGFAVPASNTRSAAMTLSDYSKKIFLWMGAGLALTFFVALGLMLWLTSGDELAMAERLSGFLPMFYGGLVAEIVLAIVLNFFVKKMPYAVSLVMFIVYSVVSGVTLTPLLVVYDAGSAIFAFAAAAVLFIAFAIYGIVTKRDLTKLGPLLAIGLVVLLLFTLLGLVFRMSGLSIIISLVGIAIFIGLTAYDTQKIKASYNLLSGDPAMLNKMSVNLALQLYLDFINLFIYILRLLGNSRR